MNKKINVLIFPCGAENAVEAYIALKDIVNIKVYGATAKSDHGAYIFENYITNVPYINSADFIETFNAVLVQNQIDVVIPTHDDVVLKLAEHQDELNSKVLVHGLHQARICRSKKLIYELFKDESFCPIVYNDLAEINEFPVFVKPDKGQGGKGSFLLHSLEDATIKNSTTSDFVFCEYLPNEEVTVDCFTNYKGELQFVGPRLRDRIVNGISARSSTLPITNEILSIATCISERLQLNGLWYFQLKKDRFNTFKLLEISLRISGTMNLYRAKGVNFPLLALYNSWNNDVEILENKFDVEVDRVLFNKYKHTLTYEYVYIDFDDTITKNESINPEVMLFLYNALNSGKKIYLITKHKDDIEITLNALKVHKGIFTKIYHLSPEEKKTDYIKHTENSIFIDNAFAERKLVHDILGIPVFDVDAVSVLIDWRQ